MLHVGSLLLTVGSFSRVRVLGRFRGLVLYSCVTGAFAAARPQHGGEGGKEVFINWKWGLSIILTRLCEPLRIARGYRNV